MITIIPSWPCYFYFILNTIVIFFFIFHFIILSGLLICSLFLLKEIFFFVYIFSDERDHNCECGQLETVEHVLKECPLHPAERDLLRKVSPELDPKILLDTKKGLGAVVKFLDSLPQLLCWWFAWLSSLLRFYWVSISGIELLGVMYLRFPLAHGYFHGKFGAIERLNLLRALTPLLCQSHRDKCFWNFMSSLYVILFCNFVCNYLM